MSDTPVIFLALAAGTPKAETLRDVTRERNAIRKALEKAQINSQCVVLEAEVRTIEDVFQVFRSYPQKISVFHYAGHGSEDALLLYLEQEQVKGLSTSALTTLLSDSSIKLVFLNCCSSQSHAKALLGAGAPAVIATSSHVHDDIACDFAQKFYEGLGNGHSIKRAFELSKSELTIQSNHSAPVRAPSAGTLKIGDHAELWKLYTNNTQGAESWKLGLLENEQPLQHTSSSHWRGVGKRWQAALLIVSLLLLGSFVVVRLWSTLPKAAIRASVDQIGLATPCENTNAAIEILDSNLETVLQSTLNISDRPLTCGDLLALTELESGAKGIRQLEGLQYATEVRSLHLEKNEIRDVSPLETLAGLKYLYLSDNPLTTLAPLQNLVKLKALYLSNSDGVDFDITPLATLVNLEQLDVSDLELDNLDSLAKLTKLTTLRAWGNALASDDLAVFVGRDLKVLSVGDNKLTDLSLLRQFASLEELGLSRNQIADIAPLRELVMLERLKLADNKITNISALVDNSGLGAGDEVDVSHNSLDLTPGSEDRKNLDALLARGVNVQY
jgi:hypothetical protein